jgi:hypothetical protein
MRPPVSRAAQDAPPRGTRALTAAEEMIERSLPGFMRAMARARAA